MTETGESRFDAASDAEEIERAPGNFVVGSRLLFENEHVRVWEMLLEPGESFPLHAHEHPYLSLILEGALLKLIGEDGSEEPVQATAGAVLWREPDVHAVRNVGDTRFRNRLVELKARR